MSSFYERKALPAVVAALAMMVAGCATFGYDDVFRNGSYRYDVDRDVSRYVAQVDRHVRMNRRDERSMARLLRDRTMRLLDRTRPENRRYVYPFPRRAYRDMTSAQYDFWRAADRSIQRNLPRTQARRYADITTDRSVRDSRRAGRYETKRDRRNRRRGDDRRYENRRYDDDDDDRRPRWGRDDDDDDDDDDDRRRRRDRDDD